MPTLEEIMSSGIQGISNFKENFEKINIKLEDIKSLYLGKVRYFNKESYTDFILNKRVNCCKIRIFESIKDKETAFYCISNKFLKTK